MAITWRTTGVWGAGKGGQLTGTEFDETIYTLVQQIAAAAAAAGSPVGVADISSTNGTFSVTLTDATVLGPFNLPRAAFSGQGAWTALTVYAENDVVYVANSGAYLVLQAHTAAATFDSARKIGGSYVYQLLMPAGTIATQQVKTVSASTYTFLSTDVDKLIMFTNPAGCTATIPAATFTTNDELFVCQDSSSPVTLAAADPSMWRNNELFGYATIGQGSLAAVKNIGSDIWIRSGNLEEAVTA